MGWIEMRRCLVVLLMLAGLVISADAEPQSPSEAEALLTQVRGAYQRVKTYDAAMTLHVRMHEGQWRSHRWTPVRMVYDRDRAALRLVGPEWVIIHSDTEVFFQSVNRHTHYARNQADTGLNAKSVDDLGSLVPQPLPPPVIFLLSDNPVEFMAKTLFQDDAGQVRVETVDENDEARRPAIHVEGQSWRATMWVDPATHLINGYRLTINAEMLDRDTTEPMVVDYEFQGSKVNEPVDESLLSLDTAAAEQVESLRELMSLHRLVGRAAPPVTLNTPDGVAHDFEKQDGKLIVFEFWASWCGPCRISLPQMQKVADWAKQENLPVAFYGINVEEPAETAANAWSNLKIEFPTLIDEEGRVAAAYGISAIPTTFIIKDGKVVYAHEGVIPDAEVTLQTKIESLLPAN